MKKSIICVLFFFAVALYACQPNTNEEQVNTSSTSSVQQNVTQTTQPLNLIILLDLSDRVVRRNIVPQKDNDIDIIKHLLDKFKYNAFHPGPFIKCKNHFQIIFYPSPSGHSQISTFANQMNIDLAPLNAGDKREVLNAAENNIPSVLDTIYDVTIQNKKWVGCDIWGFFSYGQIDNFIRQGYRNVLVILTDGYIYHSGNKQQQGENYSYISPHTLQVAGSGMINGRPQTLPKLNSLEVLMLEVNPVDIKDYPKMQNIIGNWLTSMGVQRYKIVNKDLLANITAVIDNFLDNN